MKKLLLSLGAVAAVAAPVAAVVACGSDNGDSSVTPSAFKVTTGFSVVLTHKTDSLGKPGKSLTTRYSANEITAANLQAFLKSEYNSVAPAAGYTVVSTPVTAGFVLKDKSGSYYFADKTSAMAQVVPFSTVNKLTDQEKAAITQVLM